MTSEDRESSTKDKNATNDPSDDIDGVVETKNDTRDQNKEEIADASHASLKYSLLGPSLTKAGQDSVDQSKVGLSQFPCFRVLLSPATDKFQLVF